MVSCSPVAPRPRWADMGWEEEDAFEHWPLRSSDPEPARWETLVPIEAKVGYAKTGMEQHRSKGAIKVGPRVKAKLEDVPRGPERTYTSSGKGLPGRGYWQRPAHLRPKRVQVKVKPGRWTTAPGLDQPTADAPPIHRSACRARLLDRLANARAATVDGEVAGAPRKRRPPPPRPPACVAAPPPPPARAHPAPPCRGVVRCTPQHSEEV